MDGQFPFRFDGSIEVVNSTAAIVAYQMEINMEEVSIHIFKDNIREIQLGDMGYRLFTEADWSSKMAAGLYFDKMKMASMISTWKNSNQ